MTEAIDNISLTPGADGRSAYQIALELAYAAYADGEGGGALGIDAWKVGTDYADEATWIASLRGADGANGADGADGVSDVTAPEILDIAIAATGADGEGVLNAGDVVTVTVTFSEAVLVTNAPELFFSLSVGTNERFAAYAGGAGTDRLTFTYTIAANDSAPDGISYPDIDVEGFPLLVRVASHEVSATVAAVLDRLDVATGQAESAAALGLNDIGTVRFVLSAPLIAEPVAAGNALGRLILIDRYDSATLGGGLVLDVADEGAALSGRAYTPDDHLSGRARPPGLCLWLTGLSGAGKTTIAALVERQLRACGRPVILLDGDRIRQGLSRDLGFSPSDRVENMRRVGEVAALMADAGLVVLVALISPFAAERRMVRDLVGPGRFVEVFVDTSLAECERRDVKGLYARARRGEVRAFTGLDSPYEPPSAPDLVLATAGRTPEDCAGELLRRIHAHPVAGA